MEEELIEPHPLWKRILIIVIGLFLLGLILSYFLLSYPIFPILESLLESKNSEDNKITLDNLEIIFEGNTFDQLHTLYHSNQSVEFAACLNGEKQGNQYLINQVFEPEISSQTFNHVSFKPCPTNSLILLHSHPYRRCIASEQDLITLEEIKQENPDILMVIMCEPNRFSVYG